MTYTVFIYAVFILIGGILGHARSGSMASLVSGLVFGILLLVAAGGMLAKKKWGTYFATFLTFILTLFFTYRFFITFKFMPPGLLSLISLGILILLIIRTKILIIITRK